MIKSDKTNRRDVLVCVLKSPRDRKILLEGSYRIPLSHAPRKCPKYLAFYQPVIFGKSGKMIELYGRVKNWQVKKRIEFLPEERYHPRFKKPYIEFIFNRISKLRNKLVNRSGLRISFGFTTLSKLRHSSDLRQLFDIPPMEDILAGMLKKNSISFYRQYTIRSKDKRCFRLDFALPGKKGWLNVECDSFRWHSRKKQQEKDRKKDKKLKELKWKVLRITEEELFSNPSEVITRIKKILHDLQALQL